MHLKSLAWQLLLLVQCIHALPLANGKLERILVTALSTSFEAEQRVVAPKGIAARDPSDPDENVTGAWASWQGEAPASPVEARHPRDSDENVGGVWREWQGEAPPSTVEARSPRDSDENVGGVWREWQGEAPASSS